MRWVVLLLVALSACGTDGSGPTLPDRVDCVGASPGEACTEEGQWCATANQCGLGARYCHCASGTFHCTEPYSAAEIETCTVIAEASCFLEGTGFCDRQPEGGGTCGCHDGAWSCQRSCDGCPGTLPSEGQGCATQNACRYAGTGGGFATTCSCVAGMFHCQQTP